jgi:hypothetical protein
VCDCRHTCPVRGDRARRVGATGLVWLTALLLLLATLAGYARRSLFDSDQFANRAASTLRDDSVRSLAAERITDQVVLKQQADLIAARPVIQSIVSTLIGGSAFRTLFVRSVRDVHRAVFQRDQNTVTLTLADVGTVAGAALERFRPTLAAKLTRSGSVTLVKDNLGSAAGTAARWAEGIRVLAYVLAGLTLVAAAGAIVLSTDRRTTVAQLGVAIAVVGILVVIAYTVSRAIVLSHLSDPDERAAAGDVWSAFLGDLRTFGWVLAGSGAVVAAAASSVLHPVEIQGALRRGWRIAAGEPKAAWLRVLRGLALIALGVLVIAQPITALQVVATLVGVYIVYLGVEAILRLTYQPGHAEAHEEVVELRHRVRRLAVPALAVLLIGGAVATFLATGGTSETAAASVNTCNGYAALCDKTLPEVVLPATHNAMSAPLPGWFSSEQDRSIGGQLDDGIRGLLIDTHYGDKLANGRVRTDISNLQAVLTQDGVSQDQLNAALRLRGRAGFKGQGTRGMYLCHTLCELGATPLATGLKEIHDFIVTHPDNVLVVINQDYVTPADYVKAISDAGLSSYVYKGLGGSHWPTLREMIEQSQQIVFLAENKAGGASWYQLAYKSLVEETPYKFPKASLLTSSSNLAASCKPNRGPSKGAPLFLENHWVSTDPIPLPSDAKKVNAYQPLLARSQRCEQIRDHIPNLIAVNFYKQGDLFKVVNKLNGVS